MSMMWFRTRCLKTAKADIYRKRLEEKDTVTKAAGHIDALASPASPESHVAPLTTRIAGSSGVLHFINFLLATIQQT